MIDNIQKHNRNNENSGGSSSNDRQRSHLPHEEVNQNSMYSSRQIRLSYPDIPSTQTSTPSTPVPSTSSNYPAAADTVLNESHDLYDSDSSYHTAPLQNDDSMTAEQEEVHELRLQRDSIIQERMELTDELELEKSKAAALNLEILKVKERMSLKRDQKRATATTSAPKTKLLLQLKNSNNNQSSNSHQGQNTVPFITQIIPAKPKRDKLKAKVVIVISDDDDDDEAMDTSTPNHSNSNNTVNENRHVDTPNDQRSRPVQPDLTSSSSLFNRRPKRRNSPKEEATYTTKKKRTRNTPDRVFQIIKPKKKVKKEPQFIDPSPADELSQEREVAKKIVIGSHISGQVAIVHMRAQFCDLHEYAKRHELSVYQQANLDVLIEHIISCWGYSDDHVPAPLLNRNDLSPVLPDAQLPPEYYGDVSTIDYDAYRLDSLSLLRAVRYFLNGTTDYANIQIPMHLQLELSELNDQEKGTGIYINENFDFNDLQCEEEEDIEFDDDIDSNQSRNTEEADACVEMLPGRDTQTRFVSLKESKASPSKQPLTYSFSPSDITMLDLLLKSVNDSYINDSNQSPSLRTISNIHETRQLNDPSTIMKNPIGKNMPYAPFDDKRTATNMAGYALTTPIEPCKFEQCDDPHCPYMHTI